MAQSTSRGEKHTVEIVGMWVESAAVLQGGVEPELPELCESLPSEIEPRWHNLDPTFAQHIVDHVLILLHLYIEIWSIIRL